jgi:hypothetical protein
MPIQYHPTTTPLSNTARSLHYHKIVENEHWVSNKKLSMASSHSFSTRATPRNGFLPSQRPLATATPNALYSCSSSPSRPVRLETNNRETRLTSRAGPRFALCGLWYILTRRPNSTLPKFVAGVGIFRTLTCGGWTYVTSTDAHDWHDIFMISYLVATLPWTLGCLALSPNNPNALKYRKLFAGSFFATLVPLIYFFIQHKVHKVAGGTFYLPRCGKITDFS